MVTGTLVSRRGGDGWGFDFYFQPDGFKQTYSELGPEQKNLISHRRRGLDAMRKKLGENGLG
jgi:XTP/dITP diphosphohydrolase